MDSQPSRVKELTVFALSVFGEFAPRVATGVYSNDLYGALVRISGIGNRQLRNIGICFPITQRLAKCASFGLWRPMSIEFVEKETLSMADCSPWAGANFVNYRTRYTEIANRAACHPIGKCARRAWRFSRSSGWGVKYFPGGRGNQMVT